LDRDIVQFVQREIEDEWERLLKEFSSFSYQEFIWQPDSGVHSIGWHVRHAIEWRYALVHVWLAQKSADETLFCLGWEREPMVQAISRNRGWYEPSFTVRENVRLLERVRAVTRRDLETMTMSRYSERVVFPWRSNRVLEEISQDVRHSALHRGHIRQLRKIYQQRACAPCFTDMSSHVLEGAPQIDGGPQ
jgi:hypothetical protein